MFFRNKKKSDEKCMVCGSKINDEHSFCPYCGKTLLNPEKETKNFGMLGRNDVIDEQTENQVKKNNLGITDKIIFNIFNNLVRTLDTQFREMENTEVRDFPNGIKISVGMPSRKRLQRHSSPNKQISEEQMKKINSFPRAVAKTNIRRLSDKIVYELNTPGLQSVEDVFVSKLEIGYEVKAIGEKKVYVNSLPINLPLYKFAIDNGKLLMEFKSPENF